LSHLVLEGILIASVVYLFFFTKTYRPKKTEKLSKAVRHCSRAWILGGHHKPALIVVFRKKRSLSRSGSPSRWSPS
jgi:hypothetical protein